MKFFSGMILVLTLITVPAAAAPAQLRPAGLRVESLTQPVGLDAAQPRFSWEIDEERTGASALPVNPQFAIQVRRPSEPSRPQSPPRRGVRQTAYQILVAATTATLAAGRGDLWDSGRIASAQSHLVPYEGKPLESSRRYVWQVRFWDEAGQASPWSAPASWISGLFIPLSEWRAEWLGLDAPPDSLPAAGAEAYGLAEAKWITHPDSEGPADFFPYSFCQSFRVQKAALRRASAAVHSDNNLSAFCLMYVNGAELLQFGWGCPKAFEITDWVRDGENIITFRDSPRLIGSILLEYRDGRTELIRTGAGWRTSRATLDHWDLEAIRRAPWVAVQTVAGNGQSPMLEKVDVTRALMPPAVRLRREFTLRRPVRLAVLHATALGLCEVWLNGRRAGANEHFKPGWTQYDRRLNLVSTDVTALLHPGVNALGAELADGWYAGNIAWFGRNPHVHPRLAAQLHVEYDDGSREVIATAPGWKARHSPTRQADPLMGEVYDARLDDPGWSAPGYDDHAWAAADTGSSMDEDGAPPRVVDVTNFLREAIRNGRQQIIVDNTLGGDPAAGSLKQLVIDYAFGDDERTVVLDEGQTLNLPPPSSEAPGLKIEIHRAQYGRFRLVTNSPPCVIAARPCPPVQPSQELAPVRISQPRGGLYVFDFGQNLTGWTRLTARGRAGERVTIRYAEALRPDGTLDTNNLRSISPADAMILKGGGEEGWEPRFTFHGFRYAQVAGLSEPPTTRTLTAVAAGSAGPITSTFHCSSPLLDQLYQLVCRTQRSNLFEGALCGPQRDERLCLLSDFAPFLATALYNQRGLDSFGWKVMLDILDRQVDDGTRQSGNFGKVAPVSMAMGSSAPAPLDGGILAVLLPWSLYQFHGDLAPARRAYPALRRYVIFVEQTIRNLEARGGQPGAGGGLVNPVEPAQGDLFGPVPAPPRTLIARACAAIISERMADLATWTGHPEDAEHDRAFAQHVRAGFTASHVLPDGRIESESQTAYALALGLAGPKERAPLAERLIRRVEQDGCHPRVGTIGAGALLPALAAAGRPDLAYRVLTCQGAPSWGAMLEGGATTAWETWTREGNPVLNRLPLASCGEWFFSGLLGIAPLEPGFKRIRIAPQMACGLAFAEGSIQTVYGVVGSAWKAEGGRMELKVNVPPNTVAELHLPLADAAGLQEGDRPVAEAPGVKIEAAKKKGNAPEKMTVVEVGSGEYCFEWPAQGEVK